MKIISGVKWEVAIALQGDLPRLLDEGWEPYAATSHGSAIRHMLRRRVTA